MKTTKVDDRIQAFMARKTEQYPDLDGSFDEAYREVVHEDRLDRATPRDKVSARRLFSMQKNTPRFSSNHYNGLNYAR